VAVKRTQGLKPLHLPRRVQEPSQRELLAAYYRPGTTIAVVEEIILSWVDRSNNDRLHSLLRDIPDEDREAARIPAV
jgi:hypothetical protein